MSVMTKDFLITSCADAVRTALGSSEGIKAGELSGKIAALSSGGAKLIESGEVTTTTNITSSARAMKITLSRVPDLFVVYLESENEEVVAEKLGATVGAFCMKVEMLAHLSSQSLSCVELNGVIKRTEGSSTYLFDFTAAQASISEGASVVARVCGNATIPLRPNTYYWEAYELWKEDAE